MLKKIIFNPIFLILLGTILGISSKYGDIAYANTFFSYFGLLSSGILIWLALCTTILLFTKEKKNAMVLIVSLMLSMLTSYYLFSFFVVKYISIKIVFFWIVILGCSLLITHYIWNIRFCQKFRKLFVIASVLSITYDAFNVNSFEFLIMIPEIIFSVIVLLLINKSIKNKTDSKITIYGVDNKWKSL